MKPAIADGYYDDSDMAEVMAMSAGSNIPHKLTQWGIRPRYVLLLNGDTNKRVRLYTKAQAVNAARRRRLELNARMIDGFLKGGK